MLNLHSLFFFFLLSSRFFILLLSSYFVVSFYLSSFLNTPNLYFLFPSLMINLLLFLSIKHVSTPWEMRFTQMLCGPAFSRFNPCSFHFLFIMVWNMASSDSYFKRIILGQNMNEMKCNTFEVLKWLHLEFGHSI